jgi:hypothetical protein
MPENDHGNQPDRIVIRPEDLDPEAWPPPTAPPQTPPTALPPNLPPIGSYGTGSPENRPTPRSSGPAIRTQGSGPSSANLRTMLSANGIVIGLLGGAVGGLLGAIAAEVVGRPDRLGDAAQMRVHTGVFIAVFGLLLGGVLGAWEGITTGSLERVVRDGAVGAILGLVAGFIGGWLAQFLFSELRKAVEVDSQSQFENLLRVAYSGAWAVFGSLLGLGLGIRSGVRRMAFGFIGGAIGGGIAGLIFVQLQLTLSDVNVTMLRFVGLTVTGVGVGVGIGVVERLGRVAWIRFVDGPMTGKEIILYKPVTTLGTDYRCDVVLVRDTALAPTHASITRDPGGTRIDAQSTAAVIVNGVATNSRALRRGDRVQLGPTTILYQERAVS